MSRTSNYTKDPDSRLDFAANWSKDGSPWLASDEVIVTSVWFVPSEVDDNDDPIAETLTTDEDSFTATKATIWLLGGVLGNRYAVVNRITTDQGRTEDHTLNIFITEH